MPTFDLPGFRIAKYGQSLGTITYSDHTSAGEGMSANLELKFAEGRLYAEGRLAEYLKMATGGTISVGVKYIPSEAQILMYGATESTRQIGELSNSISGLKFSSKDSPNYVGISFYAPDRIDGEQKYSCVFVPKVLFGPPSYVYQTKGESITFQTPTTTGEFLPDELTGELIIETAIADTIDDAVEWCKLVLGESDDL